MSQPASSITCHIVNLQPALGGAEVFTMFFARAVRGAGCRAVLYVHPAAGFWNHLAADGVEIVHMARDMEILARLDAGSWIVTHAPVSAGFADAARVRHWLTGFCHMPLAGRTAGVLARYHLVYAVSAYVLSTLAPAGVPNAYPEAVYGMAELERGWAGARRDSPPSALFVGQTQAARPFDGAGRAAGGSVCAGHTVHAPARRDLGGGVEYRADQTV